MLHAIDRKCDDLKTAPELRAILLKALKAWTHSLADTTETPFLVDPTSASTPALTRLIANQNDIGWKHVFLGRFCTDWSDVQDAHYATMLNKKEGKRRTGEQWQKEIINEIWSQWFLVWAMRNQDLHGVNESTRARAEREETERTLRDIYDLREQMEPSVQQLLCKELADHFAKPLWFNKNWLAIHGPLVKKSVQRAKKKAIQGVRSIRQYFTTR